MKIHLNSLTVFFFFFLSFLNSVEFCWFDHSFSWRKMKIIFLKKNGKKWKKRKIQTSSFPHRQKTEKMWRKDKNRKNMKKKQKNWKKPQRNDYPNSINEIKCIWYGISRLWLLIWISLKQRCHVIKGGSWLSQMQNPKNIIFVTINMN